MSLVPSLGWHVQPSLGWHQDGWYWDDVAAGYDAPPSQLFAMYYLTNTSAANGCLRVLPRSHRSPHALHEHLKPAHSEGVRSISATERTASAARSTFVGMSTRYVASILNSSTTRKRETSQRSRYIPASGDRQEDPSVVKARAAHLLHRLCLVDSKTNDSVMPAWRDNLRM